MVTELKDLLHDAAEAPNAGSVDTDALLSQAKQRVSRRRRSRIAGLGVAVASVTLIAGVLTRSDPAPPPRPPTQPSPSTIDETILTKAPMAVRGEDYRVLNSYDVRNLAGSPGRLVEAMTAAGMIVYRDGRDGSASASQIGLLDPTRNSTTALPRAIAQIGANRIITDDTMIAGASYGVPAAAVWYFDTATRQWGQFGMDDLVAGGITSIDPTTATVSRIQFVTDSPDELFLSVRPADAPDAKARLVSVTLGGGSSSAALDPIDYGELSLWAFAAGTLASIPDSGADSNSITLSDLSTGSEQTVKVPDSDNCTVRQIWLRVDRIVALQECSVGDRVESRLQVLDLKGTSLDTLQAPSFEVVSTANNLMMLRSDSPSGLFLYNMTTGDLLRLTRHNSAFEDVAAGEQTFWAFTEPIQQGAGLRVWVADFGE